MESFHAGRFIMKFAPGLTKPSFVSRFRGLLARQFSLPKMAFDIQGPRPEQAATPAITPLSRNAGSVWNQVWREAAYS